MMKKIIALLLIIITSYSLAYSQDIDSTRIYKKRKILFFSSATAIYTGSMITLNNAWYKGYEQTSFHFYNDNDNWQMADKAGHALFAYYLSSISYKSLSWAGYKNKKATLYGGLTGFMFQTVIEILDGHSERWGASPGDLIANTAGCILFVSQQLIWNKQRIGLKISYHPTDFPDYRPDLLGSSSIESILKDYNGQTTWLSFNLSSFLSNSNIPNWLNIAIGYNAHGMTGASANVREHNGNAIPAFTRSKKFVLSPDVNWSNIKTHKSWLKAIFDALDIIKFPAPSVAYDTDSGWQFFLIYF